MQAQLRPLTFGEILDGAFTLYRRHFATLALTSVLVTLPIMAIYVLQALVSAPTEKGVIANLLVVMLAFPLGAFSYALGRPALIRQLSNAYLGQEVSRADGFAVGRKRFWGFLLTGVLAYGAIFIGFFFFVVPSVLLAIMFFATEQVVALEGTWGPEALSRSATLAKGAWMRIVGIQIVLYLILYMPIMALGFGGVLLLPAFVGRISPGQVTAAAALFQVGFALLSAMLQPLMFAGQTLLYYDRRVRTEGLDLAPPPSSVESPPPAFA